MKQFYETYNGNEKFSPVVREISWTNNVLIMMAAKTNDERNFYLTLSVKNNYSKRKLERQIDSALFVRTILSDIAHKQIAERGEGLSALGDSYVLEIMDLQRQIQA